MPSQSEKPKEKKVNKKTKTNKKLPAYSFYRENPLTSHLGKTISTTNIGILHIPVHNIMLLRYRTSGERSKIISPQQFDKFAFSERIEELTSKLKSACNTIKFEHKSSVVKKMNNMTSQTYTLYYNAYRQLVKDKYRIFEEKLWESDKCSTDTTRKEKKIVPPSPSPSPPPQTITKKINVEKITKPKKKKSINQDVVKSKSVFDQLFEYSGKKSGVDFISFVSTKKMSYSLMKPLIKSDLFWTILENHQKK